MHLVGPTKYTAANNAQPATTTEVLIALREAAAQNGGRQLTQEQVTAVYARFPLPSDVINQEPAFERSVAELLDAQNYGAIDHVISHDQGAITAIVTSTTAGKSFEVISIRRKDNRVMNSLHKLLAAKQLGYENVWCVWCSMQEETSA